MRTRKAIETIEFKDVSFAYPGSPAVLHDVSLTLPMHAICHVTGPSGHGQATLLKILSFLAAPTQGGIFVNGENATEMSFEEFLPYRLDVGYTFEMGGLMANRTLQENMALPYLYHKIAPAEEVEHVIHKMAQRFKFEDALDRRPANVSSGLRKLVAILRAVLLMPSVLVMDDPFAGLDPDTAHALEKLLLELRASGEIKTIFFTSRDETWPARLGAVPLWVEHGQIALKTGSGHGFGVSA